MAIVHHLRFADPSPMAKRLLWHLLTIGKTIRDEPEVHPARDKVGMLLFWVTSGRGTLQAGRSHWNLSAGPQCWLVDMAQPRSFIPEGRRRLTTSAFRFDGPALETWCKSLGGSGEFRFPSRAGITRLQKAHEHMEQLVSQRPANFEWHLHESITRVFGQLLAVRKVLLRPVSEATPPEPVTRVLQAVLANPSRAWRAAELVSLADISYSGLRSAFRESQHESLSEFLRRVRLDQARMLLLDDRLSVKEISSRLGFSSEFYFSQWFRRFTGSSPSHFRDTVAD